MSLLPGLLMVFLSFGCSTDDPTQEERADHLILVSVDTWRADHFLTKRGGIELTPELAGLARESLVFSHAQSVSNVTSPGVASILTGLLPNRSGVQVNVHMLRESVPSLGTVLSRAGFTTAAFVGNPVLAPGNGFENGFETYELLPRERRRRKVAGGAVTDRVIAWLEEGLWEAREQRLFLWVHYMDPHGPYEPPPEMEELFSVDAFGGVREVPLQPESVQSGFGGIPFYQQYGKGEPSTDPRNYEMRYAAAVRNLDDQIGRLLEYLRASDLLDYSVLVLTADHGEALDDDHGFFFSHGHGLTQDQTAVPLLLRYPGVQGRVVAESTASTLDVVPTVLELLDVESEMALDGRPLGQLRSSADAGFALSQTIQGTSLTAWPWKVVRLKRAGTRLYNLASDPEESLDLAFENAALVRRLQSVLREAAQKPRLARPISREDIDDETRKALETLGYL